jgi:hypothetical protein
VRSPTTIGRVIVTTGCIISSSGRLTYNAVLLRLIARALRLLTGVLGLDAFSLRNHGFDGLTIRRAR